MMFKMRTNDQQVFGPNLILVAKVVKKGWQLPFGDRSAFEEALSDVSDFD